MLQRHIGCGYRRSYRGAGRSAHFEDAAHPRVIRITPHGAVERELPGLVRHKLDGDHFARLDGTGVHPHAADREAVDDVLRADAQTNPLALVHHDALAETIRLRPAGERPDR